ASNPEYLLKAGGGIILNPGEPVVRDFIVNTCLEVVEKYDVDAIHFDDYFYADKVDDTATRAKYNTDGLSVEDFRRLQVDLFIEQLSTAMRQFNSENDRVVQLGISPTGIYRNSGYSAEAEYDIDGNLISPIGSNTAGWEHYGHYLYCDTKKWVDNEWIDYILPQSYWAFEHNVAGYADVMDWWDRVVRNKKVNLYSGMGIYRVLSNNTYWYHKTEEALNEIKYGTKLEDVRGHCIYSYKHLKAAFQGGEYNYYFTENFRKVKTEAWTHKAIMPEIRTYNSVKLPAVQNLSLSQGDNANILTFDNNPNAKFYVIYRSIKPITYAPEEIYDIIGVDKSALTAAYSDKDNGLYFYAVRALSKTNTLSEGTATDDDFYCVTFKNEDGTIITVKGVTPGGSVTPPAVAKEGYDLIGWSEDLSEVNSDIEVYPIFQIKQYTVTFIVDDETYDVKTVNHGASLTPPEIPEKAGYNQTAPVWSVAAFSEIKEDLIVYAQYSINVYTVTFIVDDETYIVKTVNHGASLTPPEIPEKMGYERVAPVWSIAAFSEIKEDLTVYAQYTINIYTVKFIGFKDEILKTENVEHGQDATAPDAPIVSGYTFESWDTTYTNVADDLTVSAIYKQKAASFSCSKINIFGGFSTLAAILYLIFRRRY
ncbi:MAG: family 10 glycosylhydrolase, partial [Bacilli bacterium]|nr:family 10 glycosylhydrolase [Bacilli bacterium]